MFVCQRCGLITEKKYGSGKYASSICSKAAKKEKAIARQKGVSYKERYGDKADSVRHNLWIHRNQRPIQTPYQVKSGEWWIIDNALQGDDNITLKRPVRYYRFLAEKYILGRRLEKSEVVHHIDKNRSNNDITNLQVVSHSEHANIHKRDRLDARFIKCGY